MNEDAAVSQGSGQVASTVTDRDPPALQAIAALLSEEAYANGLQQLAGTWAVERQRLESRTGRIARLQSDLAATERDYQRNLTEMMNALIAAELRLRGNARQIEELRAMITALEADIAAARAVEAGMAWRFASAVQRVARRHPWLARQIRRGLLLIWWTLRGQVVWHLRDAIAHRRRLSQAPQAAPLPEPAPLAVPAEDPEPPEIDDPWPADRPLVSVIIPCFNYGQFVEEAVESVLNQTYRDLEVILVEGGSSALESRQLLLGLQRSGVRVLLQGGAQLVGANRNLGIRHARGRYVCCLDADDKLQPTYIEKAVFLLERCGYDLVSSALRYFGNRAELIPIVQWPDLSLMLEANHVATTAVFRRTFWEKAGGYQDARPDEHGHIPEDWRLWVRMAALGARFINLPRDPMLLYRSHGPSLSKTAAAMDMQREMVRRFNADVLDPASGAQALTESTAQRHRVPLSHLSRGMEAPSGPSLLLALPFMILGGAERLLSALVGYLVSVGWRVVVITTLNPGAEHGDTCGWFEAHTTEIFRLPGSLPEEHWDEFLRYLVMSRRIDVLWVVGSTFVYRQLPALKWEFPRLKVADLLFNTVGHTENNRRYRCWIDLNLVENEEVARWLIADGEAPDRVCLVRSGVDTQRLRPASPLRELRSSIGVKLGDVVVGFSGRWSEEKGPLAFVEIARRVDSTLPVHFVMTGGGELRPMVERAVAAAGFAPGRFHVLGMIDDVIQYLNTYDLLLLPSRLDGRPVVVMEALSIGVPVLASRVGALPEMIEEGLTGWLCEPADVAGFVTRIEQVAREPAVLAPMRRAARLFAERHFDEHAMHVLYEERLRSLVSLPWF